ncbi:hypothetical protein IG631_17336 [Alternaria alternata]|nr:hypothetical protein IG631_17336 [Alternaria alternata]
MLGWYEGGLRRSCGATTSELSQDEEHVRNGHRSNGDVRCSRERLPLKRDDQGRSASLTDRHSPVTALILHDAQCGDNN